MGTKYTTTAASGYNAVPIPDDAGTATASNEILWATIKTKLGDPVKTLAEGIDTKLVALLDQDGIDAATTYTALADDHNRVIDVTASATVSLDDAATMGLGYSVTIKNSHTAANTVGRITALDTIDGTAADVTVLPGNSITFTVNTAGDGYVTKSSFVGFDTIYPVGSVYTLTASTNPATLFGIGTWVQISKGSVLIGEGTGGGDTYTAGATGGSKDAINVSHTHTVTDAGHTHTEALYQQLAQ